MIGEFLQAWKKPVGNKIGRGSKEEDDADESDDDDDGGPTSLATPLVVSPTFRRSLRSCLIPRILLLAPGMSHRFNHQLHRELLALDYNSNLSLDLMPSHVYVSRKTIRPNPSSLSSSSSSSSSSISSTPDAFELAAATSRAHSALAAIVATNPALQTALEIPTIATPNLETRSITSTTSAQKTTMLPATLATSATSPAALSHPSQQTIDRHKLALNTSIFDHPTWSTPALLRYTVYRSAMSGIWNDLSRLQAALEQCTSNSTDGVEPNSSSSSSSTPPDVFLSRHTHIHTLSSHGLCSYHRFFFLPCQSVPLDPEIVRRADQLLIRRSSMTRNALSPHDIAEAEQAARDKTMMETLNARRIDETMNILRRVCSLAAFGTPRVVIFDQSDAGRLTASLMSQLYPSLAFTPTYLPMSNSGSVYSHFSTTLSSAGVADHFLIGSIQDLSPLITLMRSSSLQSSELIHSAQSDSDPHSPSIIAQVKLTQAIRQELEAEHLITLQLCRTTK